MHVLKWLILNMDFTDRFINLTKLNNIWGWGGGLPHGDLRNDQNGQIKL